MKGRKDLVASAAYLPEPAAVAAARKFVRDTLRSWLDTAPGAAADGGLVDDAVLLTVAAPELGQGIWKPAAASTCWPARWRRPWTATTSS